MVTKAASTTIGYVLSIRLVVGWGAVICLAVIIMGKSRVLVLVISASFLNDD